MSHPEFVEHSGGKTRIDADGYVQLGSGKLHWQAFVERLRCSRIAEQYGTEMGWGPHTYASNVISARILSGINK